MIIKMIETNALTSDRDYDDESNDGHHENLSFKLLSYDSNSADL